VGALVDAESTTMLLLVTLVALLVQVYSVGYLSDEPAPALGRYYAFQSLFALSMMGLVPFGAEPAIVLRLAGGELRAFTAVCTHLSCTVQYRDDLQQIWCACHNGHYDLSGRNVSGPPPRPLKPYAVNVKGDEIVISRNA